MYLSLPNSRPRTRKLFSSLNCPERFSCLAFVNTIGQLLACQHELRGVGFFPTSCSRFRFLPVRDIRGGRFSPSPWIGHDTVKAASSTPHNGRWSGSSCSFAPPRSQDRKRAITRPLHLNPPFFSPRKPSTTLVVQTTVISTGVQQFLFIFLHPLRDPRKTPDGFYTDPPGA